LIPSQNQAKSKEEIFELVVEASQKTAVPIYDVDTGISQQGIDLGSSRFEPVVLPKVLLLVGNGVSSSESGQIWHLLDQRYDMEITMADVSRSARLDLSPYNCIVMVNGSYSISKEKIRHWLRNGGTLIVMRDAIKWARGIGLAQVLERAASKDKKAKNERRPYEVLSKVEGAKYIGGAICETEADLSHPLLFGYEKEKLPVFHRGTTFFEPAKNDYATPLIYTQEPLISGYSSEHNKKLMKGAAAVIVSGSGSGKVVCLANDPNFRAFWFGTNKLFANALFFSPIISSRAIERVTSPPTNKIPE